MSFQSKLFKDAAGKMYVFRMNAGDALEVGTVLLSSRKTPLHPNYDRQYMALGASEVLVVQSGEIVAVIPAFDPEFELEASDLNAISVLDAEGNVEAVYIMAGEGLLNVGTLVYDDPAGEVAYEGVIVMGQWQITIEAGAVVATEKLEEEAEEPKPAKAALLDEDGKKVIVYVANSPKFLTKIGSKVYTNGDLDEVLEISGWYTLDRMPTYSFLFEAGVVVDVKKNKVEK